MAAAAGRAQATRKKHRERALRGKCGDVRLRAPQEASHDTGQSEGRGGEMPHAIGSLRRLLHHLRANGPAHPRGRICGAPSSRWRPGRTGAVVGRAARCPRRARVCRRTGPWACCGPDGVVPVGPARWCSGSVAAASFHRQL
ncbi:hypothetical protein NN561_003303 [Cricetulus griseus]